MKKWRDAQDKNLADLYHETRDGAVFRFQLIPAWQIRQMITDGDRGDEHARIVIQAIAQWSHTIEQALKEDCAPGCVACGAEVYPGNAAGWLVLIPTQLDRTGLTGVFCHNCYDRGPDAITSMVKRELSSELGAEIMSIH